MYCLDIMCPHFFLYLFFKILVCFVCLFWGFGGFFLFLFCYFVFFLFFCCYFFVLVYELRSKYRRQHKLLHFSRSQLHVCYSSDLITNKLRTKPLNNSSALSDSFLSATQLIALNWVVNFKSGFFKQGACYTSSIPWSSESEKLVSWYDNVS